MSDAIYSDGTYLGKNPDWHVEDSPWKAQQVAKILGRNNLRPKTVCEIGCGAGEVLKNLKDQLGGDVKATGYEISPQAFDICKAKETENLEFYLKDLLVEDDVTFEVVMAIDVFEHVEDYFGFLRKLRSKGKYQIFHIPLDLSAQSVLRGSPLTNARRSVGHIHYFTKDTALATLADAGYEIIDYFYTDGSIERHNRGWKGNLLNIPRKAMFAINKDFGVRFLGGCSLLVLAR